MKKQKERKRRREETLDATTTHYLFLVQVPRAVGSGKSGRARLAVPGDVAVLGGAADGQGVDAVCVAVAVAAVLLPPAVPRSPHKDGAQTITTLEKVECGQTYGNGRPETLSFSHSSCWSSDQNLIQSLKEVPIMGGQINLRAHL